MEIITLDPAVLRYAESELVGVEDRDKIMEGIRSQTKVGERDYLGYAGKFGGLPEQEQRIYETANVE